MIRLNANRKRLIGTDVGFLFKISTLGFLLKVSAYNIIVHDVRSEI